MLAWHSGMLKSDGCNRSCMRILYYPPVPPEDEGPCCQGDGKAYTRCGAHSDACTFTLVAQDSEGGLEVRLTPKKTNEYLAEKRHQLSPVNESSHKKQITSARSILL